MPLYPSGDQLTVDRHVEVRMSALSPIVAAFKEGAEINPETSAMSRTFLERPQC